MEQSLILVYSLLSNLEMSSLLPEVCHEIHLSRENVAHNCRVDILSGLEKLVSKCFSYLLDLGSIFVGNYISKGLFPGAALLASQTWRTDLFDDRREIVLCNCLHDFFDKDVFMMSEILGFDLIEELFAARLSNQKSFSGSSRL